MSLAISAPPMPSTVLIAAVGLSGVVVGVALIVGGRKAGRPLLALVLAIAAALGAPLFADRLPVKNVWVVGVAAAVTASLLAFVFARALWAAVLGAALAVAALAAAAHFGSGGLAEKPVWNSAEFETFGAWYFAAADYLLEWLQALWRHAPVTVVLAVGAPLILCVAAELVLPKSILILGTSAFGAASAVAGAGLLTLAVRADWARAWVDRVYIPAAVAAGVTLIGIAWQWRSELRERAAEAAEEEPERPPGGTGRGSAAAEP